MQRNGFAIDQRVAHRYLTVYRFIQQEVCDKILQDPMIVKMTAERNKDKEVISKSGKKRKKKKVVWVFNPGSSMQRAELLYMYYGLSVMKLTKNDNPSTDADALKPYEKKYPIVKDIIYYNLLDKMISTYLLPATTRWLSADGRVRTSFNQHGSRTGRLSSTDPNIQNIPTPEKQPGTLLEYQPIKNIFTHTFPKGRLLVFDYSGMELRIFASVAGCEPMLEILEDDTKDVHTMTAVLCSKIPYEKITKPIRYKYKSANWTLLFGGGAETLASAHDIPFDEAKDIMKNYFRAFPEVPVYLKTCQTFGEGHGYIESPFGRREHLAYIQDREMNSYKAKDIRSAVNMPVQSGASDTLMCALVIIDKLMEEHKMKSMLVNTVHDSIVADAHPDEIDAMAELCKNTMNNVKELAKTYMPHVDFRWLVCPLKTDISIGTHYGTEEDYYEWKKERVLA